MYDAPKAVIVHQFSTRGYYQFINDTCFYFPQTNKNWIQFMTSLQKPSNEQIEATALKVSALFDKEKRGQTHIEVIN